MPTNDKYYYNNWPNGRILENNDQFKDANGRIFEAKLLADKKGIYPSKIVVQSVNLPIEKYISKMMDALELKKYFLDRSFVIIVKPK